MLTPSNPESEPLVTGVAIGVVIDERVTYSTQVQRTGISRTGITRNIAPPYIFAMSFVGIAMIICAICLTCQRSSFPLVLGAGIPSLTVIFGLADVFCPKEFHHILARAHFAIFILAGISISGALIF